MDKILLNERASDETVINVYKKTFRKAGVSVKDFVINHDKKTNTDYFHIIFPLGIHFWVEWLSNMDAANFVSVVNDKESAVESINNPNVNSVTNSIAAEYKKIMKRQSILKQLLSLILEDENYPRNPLIKG